MPRHTILFVFAPVLVGLALGSTVAAAGTTEGYCLDYRAPAQTSAATLETVAGLLDDRLGSMGIAGDATADPVAGTVSVALPDGTEWRPEKGALLGDPTDLGTGEDAVIDVAAVVATYARWEAFQARVAEVTEDPRFVGLAGSEDGAVILLFARDSIPEADLQRLARELSGYGVPVSPGSDVSGIRGAEIDLTLARVQEIRDALADVLTGHGLSPDALQLQFYPDEKPDAFIEVSDPAVEESIRQAVRDRLGKGVVRLWFLNDGWIEIDGDDHGS